MAKPKPLSKADDQLWAAFTTTITPLPGKSRPQLDPPPPEPPARPRHGERSEAIHVRPPQKPAATPIHPNTPPPGLDKSTWKTFATGRRRAEQMLDLHGHTATRAHHAVTAFIHHAHQNGLRCIEIVTGKGEILSRELPHWLASPTLRPLILAIAHAPTANTGATRILLRRRTPKDAGQPSLFLKKNSPRPG